MSGAANIPIAATNLINDSVDITERPKEITRDLRFKHIIESQLGKDGLTLLSIQSILFVLALIIIVAVVIGSLFSNWHRQSKTIFQKNATLIL